MAIKRFNGSFRTRDDVFDNITPNNIVQPKVSHPAGEWKPAAWLPVQWKTEASKDYFVMSSGKVVSLDRAGRVAPAGLRKIAPTAAGTGLTFTQTITAANTTVAVILGETIITYTSLDVQAKTEDIRTGLPVAAADTVTIEEFCEAVIQRGWVSESEIANHSSQSYLFDIASNPSTTTVQMIVDQAVAVIEAFISKPVGVLAYDVYSWAGDAPGSLKFTNYQKQHLIQFITQAQMKMPQMALSTQQTSGALNGIGAWTVQSGTLNGQNMPIGSTPYYLTTAVARGLERYSVESDEVLHIPSTALVVGLYLGNSSSTSDALEIVPEINALTAANVSTMLVPAGGMVALVANRKSKISDVKSAGDYFIDAAKGILFVYDASAGANWSLGSAGTIKFYKYGGAASASHQHVYFVGSCKPGDHITWDKESNFIADSNPAFGTTLGRVLEVQSFPKSLMERTTTAWQGSSFDASMRMPGTATEGLPDNLTLAGQGGEVVGNRMVIANIQIL